MENSFEVIDINTLRRNNETLVKKIFGDISKKSAAQQVAIGGVSGWCTGFLFVKVGKATAASLGVTLLILQIAHHQGYIKINYRAIESEINKTKDKLEREARRNFPGYSNSIKRFIQKNMFLAGGFAGGFLIGMAF